MVQTPTKIAFLAFLVFALASPGVFGKVAPPRPPEENPHPPQSAEDRRRVDFAVQEIIAQYGPQVEIRHPHVIPWAFEKFLNNRKSPASSTSEAAPSIKKEEAAKPLPAGSEPMSGPALKADEYMVHTFVKFPNDHRWHHLDVILSEDAKGKLVRRGFYSIPIPSSSSRLPPGVEC